MKVKAHGGVDSETKLMLPARLHCLRNSCIRLRHPSLGTSAWALAFTFSGGSKAVQRNPRRTEVVPCATVISYS